MKRVRDLLCAAVIRTNPIFPFRSLNRLPYRMAVRSFVRLCRSLPKVRGVYLRHGMAHGDWVPGISDIDLTVTFSIGLTPHEEYLFLTRFWARQRLLRSLFPMLADVVVLPEDHLAAWTRFGLWGFEVRHWKTLSGAPPVSSYQDGEVERDALDEALYRYFERLLPWYFEPCTGLTMQRMRRVVSRMFRYAPVEMRPAGDTALLVARALLGLDRWMRRLEPEAPVESAGPAGEESLLEYLDLHLVVLDCRLGDSPDVAQDEESVRQTLLRLSRQPLSAGRVRVVTRTMLRYWFHVWNPGQYHDWLLDSRVLSGAAVLAEMEPPSEPDTVRNLLKSISLVLGFPQLEAVILQEDPAWFAGDIYRSMVERGWYLRLYLETGLRWNSHPRTIQEIRQRYPEQVQELEALQTMATDEACGLAEIRQRGFCLLRQNAQAINCALAGAAPDANSLCPAEVGA